MAFGERLKGLRNAAGFTQEQLAERSGVSKGGIRNIEQGIRSPAWETVQALAAALGVSCEAFNEPVASDEKAEHGHKKGVAPEPKPAKKKKGKGSTS